jgi:iron uptake system component EfeO
LVLGALALAACGSGPDRTPDRRVEVAVSVSGCGAGWASAHPGEQRFLLRDVDTRAGGVDLIDVRSGAVYAEVEPIAAGTTVALQVDLGSGRYAFRCVMEDETAVTGPTITIAGHVRGSTHAVRPVDQGDLIAATQAYEKYVLHALPGLAQATGRLRAALTRDDLSGARRAWLPAHLAFVRLGAAYGAFGDLAADIDERADGLPLGVHDPSWRGFHRIEFGLWHGEPAAALAPLAADLVSAVQRLEREFPHAQIDPSDVAIRAHEITEDAVEFELSGRDDYGSGSGLATVRADLDGTRVVLGMVRPLLAPRDFGLARLDAQLDRTQRDLDAVRNGGAWPAPAALPRADRERVNSDVSELAELLAPVASVLEPRRTS